MVELVVFAGIGGAVLISVLFLAGREKQDKTTHAIQTRGQNARSDIDRVSADYRHTAKTILHKR